MRDAVVKTSIFLYLQAPVPSSRSELGETRTVLADSRGVGIREAQGHRG